MEIREPATRGFLAGSTGDAATLELTYRGLATTLSPLASGDVRAQLGLKLRAQDSCNVIYVMWRIDPVSEIVVQVKRDADRHTHSECGSAGYTRARPVFHAAPPAIAAGVAHSLQASIVDDVVEVFLDARLVWRGALPAEARGLHGPAGFRTDNADVDLALRAPVQRSIAAGR